MLARKPCNRQGTSSVCAFYRRNNCASVVLQRPPPLPLRRSLHTPRSRSCLPALCLVSSAEPPCRTASTTGQREASARRRLDGLQLRCITVHAPLRSAATPSSPPAPASGAANTQPGPGPPGDPSPSRPVERRGPPFAGSWGGGSWSPSFTPRPGSRAEDGDLLPHERRARDQALRDSSTPGSPGPSATFASRGGGPSAASAAQAPHAVATPPNSQQSTSESESKRNGPLPTGTVWSGPGKTGHFRPLRGAPPLRPRLRGPELGHAGPSEPHVLGKVGFSQSDGESPVNAWPPRRERHERGPLGSRLSGSKGADWATPKKSTKDWSLLTRRNPASPSLSGRPAVSRDTRRPGPMHKLADDVREPPSTTTTRHVVPRPDEFLSRFRNRAAGSEEAVKPLAQDPWDWVDRETRPQARASVRAHGQVRMQQEPQRGPAPPSRPPAAVSDDHPPRRAERERDRSSRGHLPTKSKRRGSYSRSLAAEDDGDYDEAALQRWEERRRRKEEQKARKEKAAVAVDSGPTPILLPEFITVSSLAAALSVKPEQFVLQLGELGFDNISHDSIMTGETAALVAAEYGFEPTVDDGASRDLKPRPPPADPLSLPARPPIVTIMGHVDHGKTTMLDWLRKSSVASQEHGGITQHIGAFSVRLPSGKDITFLDTPGHAAFLTMRQRGANVTDIVILVVAADDSVKPQTLEALKHARTAKVPIIVAINKIDKDEARIDQVKADLARHGVEIEDFGGDVQVVCVSGKTGQGMDDLEETILTLSEILDIRAEQGGMAEGWVLEASIKPTGKVATVLVKRGTLRNGDYILAGTTWAKVRQLRDQSGAEVSEAGPGIPVEILGWKDVPSAGEEVLQAPDESKAKTAAAYRQELRGREKDMTDKTLRDRQEREKAEREALEEGEPESGEPEPASTKVLNFSVKGDVVGSVEAVCAAVLEIGNNEVRPRVLRSSAGQITEFDIEHAATSGSYILNFNNPIPGYIQRLAEESGVKILDHAVIYHLTEDVRDKLSDLLPLTISSRVLGEAEVLQVFPINLKGRTYKNIAGCRVRNGQITKSAKYRVLRKGEKVFEGQADSLKQGKKDVSEMRKGTECGISFEEWDDIREGDEIQAYEEIREKRRL